jgi:hypothetical protein
MATKNAPFYSMKFNRAGTIKSHKSRSAAIKAAGDFGMIYDVADKKESQVHAMSNNTFSAFAEGHSSYSSMNEKMENILNEGGLLVNETEPSGGRELKIVPTEGAYQKEKKATLVKETPAQYLVRVEGQMYDWRFSKKDMLRTGSDKKEFPKWMLVVADK